MAGYKVRYKNAKFSNKKVELDGKSFVHCEFENCLVIVKVFTGKSPLSPLKVLDMEGPLFKK